MITAKQWNGLTDKRRKELLPFRTFIPTNRYRILSGYYTESDLIQKMKSLADHRKVKALRFVLDMIL